MQIAPLNQVFLLTVVVFSRTRWWCCNVRSLTQSGSQAITSSQPLTKALEPSLGPGHHFLLARFAALGWYWSSR